MSLINLLVLFFISRKVRTQSYGSLIYLEYSWDLENVQKLLQIYVLNQAPQAFTQHPSIYYYYTPVFSKLISKKIFLTYYVSSCISSTNIYLLSTLSSRKYATLGYAMMN